MKVNSKLILNYKIRLKMIKAKPFACIAGMIIIALASVRCNNARNKDEVKNQGNNLSEMTNIRKENFGATGEGDTIELYTLTNKNGVELKVISYGGRITSLKVPDRDGNLEDVVLGFDTAEDYLEENPFFGALIGRYGNRIAKGKFSLDGQEYTLAQNNGENHLHGGEKGFDKVMWSIEEIPASNALKMKYTSEDGEEGYPGRVDVAVTYTLNDDNSLDVEYEATTNKKTVINLTQHTYFNLAGDFSQKILDHQVKINADKFLPIDDASIPTGEIREVAGTPFDFREPKPLGENINEDNEQIKRGKGYDHNWVLNDQGSGLRFAASAFHPESGRVLEVYTTEPGMQLYTGNFLDGTLPTQGGDGNYERRTGFCFETQHYPDSPNREEFPSVVLEPGEKYSSRTSFRFSVKAGIFTLNFLELFLYFIITYS